jgi:hypothetical protein
MSKIDAHNTELWTMFEGARYIDGILQEEYKHDSFSSVSFPPFVKVELYQKAIDDKEYWMKCHIETLQLEIDLRLVIRQLMMQLPNKKVTDDNLRRLLFSYDIVRPDGTLWEPNK